MNRIQVLLIEDNLTDQMGFKRFVKKKSLNYDYQIASSVSEAKDLLSTQTFDIILADHALGDGTAFDVLPAIPSNTPVIMITGNDNAAIAVKALKAGASDYLTKDIESSYLELLPITIDNVLKAQAIKNELEKHREHLEVLVEQRTQELQAEIEKRKAIEKQLRILAISFETHEPIVITDAQRYIIRVNKAFSKLTGYSAEEVIGNKMNILKSGHQDQQFYINMWSELLATGQYEGELWNRCKSGRVYPEYLTITAVKDNDGNIINYVGLLTDITEQKEAESAIKKLAFYDALTSLANRRLLIDRLEHELVIAKRIAAYGSLIYLDLDNFKPLNDTYGHHIGDELLIQVGQRLQSVLREEDTPARLGGDEFVVLIHATEESYEPALMKAQIVAKKIQQKLNKAYFLNNSEHFFSCSIGITVYPENGHNAEKIMQHADRAMYAAKRAGKNAICLFDGKNTDLI
ncbi:MAG: diguanylate cyclase [Methyloprofundus sp.]|nr:diguanylate cyclase [Methyloprofundus sp.]MBW6453112.1 diguanylate cyclase [Methyloprofundus sp.]